MAGKGDPKTEDNSKEDDSAAIPQHKSYSRRLFVVSLIVALLAAGGYYVSRESPWVKPVDRHVLVSLQTKVLFKQHDRDGDGFLSLEEFEAIASRVKDDNDSFIYADVIDENDELISIFSMFKPLKLQSMTKDFDNAWGFHGNTDSLSGLNKWARAAKDWKNFGASHFKPLLPGDAHSPKLCEPYDIIPTGDRYAEPLSSNRYLPPHLSTPAETLLHRLLAVFHPRPFVHSRFAPQGTTACVRAFNSDYVDIVFRMHAEFQLNIPPIHPFWFTPAQFTGHIVMDKVASKVLDFHMYVPADKRLNVDMEWLNGPSETENMEVDIGYMPQMELKATGRSVPAVSGGEDLRGTFIINEHAKKEDVSRIKWDQEIPFDEAAHKLEVQMYPFKKVEYLNFTDVWEAAQEKDKPVHSILLWGALDDQSC